MLRAAQLTHSVDDQALSPDALDLRAHLRQQAAQVLDVGLARGVEDLGPAMRLHRRKQDVLGTRDCRQVKHDAVAAQAVGGGDDLVLRLADVRAHLAEATEVLFHAPGADVVTAGSGHARPAEPTEQRAQQDDRRAHPAAEIVGHIAADCAAGLQHHRALAFGVPAELGQDLGHDGGVGHPRHVVKSHAVGREQGGRHLGQRGVLGTADADVAGQLSASGDAQRAIAPRHVSLHQGLKVSGPGVIRAGPSPAAAGLQPSPARSGTRSPRPPSACP